MKPRLIAAAALLAAAVSTASVPAAAQVSEVRPITGTRLDVVATGDVARVPDLVRINAGVVTQAPTAVEAIRQNAARMEAVRAALRAAGIADRDIQTSNLNLNPNYRYAENQPPQLVGYQAVNEVSVRFRDIAKTGAILDALVAQGANQINGPTLTIERPEAALDEARGRGARQRARPGRFLRAEPGHAGGAGAVGQRSVDGIHPAAARRLGPGHGRERCGDADRAGRADAQYQPDRQLRARMKHKGRRNGGPSRISFSVNFASIFLLALVERLVMLDAGHPQPGHAERSTARCQPANSSRLRL